MVNHKAAHYDAEADYTLARLLRCFAPMMTGAVDSSAHLPPAFEGESAVDRLKRRLKWRDAATEARLQAEEDAAAEELAARNKKKKKRGGSATKKGDIFGDDGDDFFSQGF